LTVAGHLASKKNVWFEGLELVNDYADDGGPVTIMSGTVKDQTYLHSILDRIRDLGLPLISVKQIR